MIKNRKLYLPYILCSIGTVMMFYIISSMSASPLLRPLEGGTSLAFILELGKYVIAFFSLIFLLYTNTFLMRRRYKEFGLYNILGMNKHNISRIVLLESWFVAIIGIVGGLLAGIILSKLAELGLMKVIGADIDYRLTFEPQSIGMTVILYAVIFLLLMVKSLIMVRKCKPLELLSSENVGEKPLKVNWAVAVLGAAILIAAYIMAFRIDNALSAFTLFFVCVIMVIAATYMLFMAGSVALCRLLQKNKKYYYKKQHFLSVSNMAFRMKRNGAGLASICILATMVLVMISSTSSLYFGIDDSLNASFPQPARMTISVPDIDSFTPENIERIRAEYEDVFERRKFVPEDVVEYSYCTIAGLITPDGILFNVERRDSLINYKNLVTVTFLAADDYNRLYGTSLDPGPGEAYIYSNNKYFDTDRITGEMLDLAVAGRIEKDPHIYNSMMQVSSTLLAVISDFGQIRPMEQLHYSEYDIPLLEKYYYYGFGSSESDDKVSSTIHAQMENIFERDTLIWDDGLSFSADCRADAKENFFYTFGGLFFVAIILSILFIAAAVMIIYYKQISEGYEDQARFNIMQKVGMTEKDIKKTVNSQVLTVFFAPLVMAGLHLVFSFNMIWEILRAFSMANKKFAIIVTVISFIIFAVFYAIIYKITAQSYYRIVSGTKGQHETR